MALAYFKKRESNSNKNEEIFTCDGVYTTVGGNIAGYNYSCTISYFQGRAWVHLQDNRQGKQISLMKEALEGLFRIRYQIEESIKKVEETGRGEVPPTPPLNIKKRKFEEDQDLLSPNLRITTRTKRKVHILDEEEDDDDIL